jgi:carboxymethylenebutenolidase
MMRFFDRAPAQNILPQRAHGQKIRPSPLISSRTARTLMSTPTQTQTQTQMQTQTPAQWISLTTPEGTLDAYLALPPAGHGPGLLLLQEIFGVNAHIRRVAEQYALAGFTVLAPDLFWRQTRRVELGYVGAEREQALSLMRSLTPDQAEADMNASLAALKTHPACTGRVGALGYCMGGRLAFNAAALCGVEAAVAYYGGGIANQLALAEKIQVPVQFHYAEVDASIPPEAVAATQAAMAQAPAAAQAEFHHYPHAQHGFNCWARAAYHPASAALAHGRSLTFLAQLF